MGALLGDKADRKPVTTIASLQMNEPAVSMVRFEEDMGRIVNVARLF
jgi:hypothetical protein